MAKNRLTRRKEVDQFDQFDMCEEKQIRKLQKLCTDRKSL